MDMLHQLLSMDKLPVRGTAGREWERAGRFPERQRQQSRTRSDSMASSQDKGVSNPDTAAETRSVPKSTGMSADDMPSEFRKALDAYNKTLQK